MGTLERLLTTAMGGLVREGLVWTGPPPSCPHTPLCAPVRRALQTLVLTECSTRPTCVNPSWLWSSPATCVAFVIDFLPFFFLDMSYTDPQRTQPLRASPAMKQATRLRLPSFSTLYVARFSGFSSSFFTSAALYKKSRSGSSQK